jgi:glucokinase
VILAGDVGATKILLEVGESRTGRWEPQLARRYATEGSVNFSAVLEAFLKEWEGTKKSGQRITAAGFGVAGPAQGNRVKMTHRPWQIDGDAIAERFRFTTARVVNDLVAAAHGIAWLGPREFVSIQPGRVAAEEPRVVLGVGTGLGIAYLVCIDGRLREVAGEGGHAGFAPATLEQARLWHWIYASQGRVSAEAVLSGHGLSRVHAFVNGADPHEPGFVLPEKISELAAAGDHVALRAVEFFFECLGTVAGDHALSAMARGGVYLTGGIVAKNLALLQAARFREAFCAKAPHSAFLMRVPVRAVTSERLVLLGAARLALGA